MRIPAILACLALATALPARAADPQAGWQVLEAVTFEEFGDDETWRVEKTFPEGYEDGAETFAISGFAVIYEAQAEVSDVLLVPQAENCPFCSGGESYGPVLEVSFAQPVGIAVPEDRIVVEGRLEAIDDAQTLQSFRLTGARLVPPGEG